jgi:hypothetical protein
MAASHSSKVSKGANFGLPQKCKSPRMDAATGATGLFHTPLILATVLRFPHATADVPELLQGVGKAKINIDRQRLLLLESVLLQIDEVAVQPTPRRGERVKAPTQQPSLPRG